MKQLYFDFLDEDNYNINNFIVFSGNVEAFYFLNRDKEEENILSHQLIFLNGENKCGKTYLGKIWKQRHNAKNLIYKEIFNLKMDDFIKYINNNIEKFDYYLLDNFEKNFDENKFFYLINTVLNNNSTILIVSSFNILKCKIKMKDLRSRVNSAMQLKIKKLSKEIKTMLINKLFADKQIIVSGEVLKYLTKKFKTNYEEVYNGVNLLISNAKEEKSKLNLSFTKKKI